MNLWYLLPAVAILTLLSRRFLRKLLVLAVRCCAALAGLALLAPAAGSIGISLGINPFNALVLGLLGVPGFGLLLMVQWFLR